MYNTILICNQLITIIYNFFLITSKKYIRNLDLHDYNYIPIMFYEFYTYQNNLTYF